MKRIILFIIFVLMTVTGSALTPAQDLMQRNSEIKGGRLLEASGSKMVFVRPALKKYTIGPMAESVDAVMVLSLKKTPVSDRDEFMDDLKSTLKNYRYYGKSPSKGEFVDVYVHMKTEDCVDELVVYDPKNYVVNSLIGTFPVEELLRLKPVSGK